MRSTSLDAFQAMCHEYYTCFVFAAAGMEKFVQTFPLDPKRYPNQQIFIGNTPPNEGGAQSVMSASKAAENAKRDGAFSDILSKSLVVRIYAEWDERYRHDMADEFGVPAPQIRSDLMGDLRRVRHWIVHRKSVIDTDCTKIKVLPWKLAAGETLYLASVMFRELLNCINDMQVEIAA